MSYTHEAMTGDAGITYRQLDVWSRKGYLRPENPNCGTGRERRWPYAELKVARTMARLAKAGLTVEAAHRVARGQEELAPGVRVVVEDAGRAALIDRITRGLKYVLEFADEHPEDFHHLVLPPFRDRLRRVIDELAGAR